MYMYNRVVCIFVAFLFIGCATTRVSRKGVQIEVVDAEGLGPIINNDIGKARKTAIHDAQKRALESVVGIYISAESLVSKAKLVEDNITGQTEGFIEKYKITKESKDKDFYKVKIKAHVRKEDLSKKIADLNLTPEKYGKPRVSFWIAEQIDNEESGSVTAELELMKIFREAGYVVSDQKPKEFYANSSAILNDNLENLERLASDIVVIGDAESNFNTDKGLGGLVSYRAGLSLKIMMATTKDIITALNEISAGVDVNRQAAAKVALAKVAKKSGKDLPQKVLDFLKERAFSSIDIQGIESFTQLKRITRSIKAYPRVKDCWVQNYSGNHAIVSVDLRRGFVSDVAKLLENNDQWQIKTKSAGKYDVSLEIISEK